MPEIITRADALSKGAKRYFTGLACKRGHIAERLVSAHGCVECRRERSAAPEGRACVRKSTAKWRNTPEGKAKERAYEEANREARKERSKVWAEANRARRAPINKAGDIHRKYNIPKWLAPYIVEHMATGTCPGCGVKFGHPKSSTRACIDHDHDTGEVRMIICHLCNSQSLRRSNDGRNPDALLLAAGRCIKKSGRKVKVRALKQLRLAALLVEHYVGSSPLASRQLMIPTINSPLSLHTHTHASVREAADVGLTSPCEGLQRGDTKRPRREPVKSLILQEDIRENPQSAPGHHIN
jgi:hypothetical protein